MQMTQDVSEIHEFFGGLRRGDCFAMIKEYPANEKYTGWFWRTSHYHPSNEDAALHFKVLDKTVIHRCTLRDRSWYMNDSTVCHEFNCIILNVPSHETNNSRCMLHVYQSRDLGSQHHIWHYDIHWGNSTTRDVEPLISGVCTTRVISFVMHSGTKSLPSICAAEGARRLEKAEFFAVLARRFGDALADELARATYG